MMKYCEGYLPLLVGAYAATAIIIMAMTVTIARMYSVGMLDGGGDYSHLYVWQLLNLSARDSTN